MKPNDYLCSESYFSTGNSPTEITTRMASKFQPGVASDSDGGAATVSHLRATCPASGPGRRLVEPCKLTRTRTPGPQAASGRTGGTESETRISRGPLAYNAEETCRLLSMMMLDAIGNFGNGSGSKIIGSLIGLGYRGSGSGH